MGILIWANSVVALFVGVALVSGLLDPAAIINPRSEPMTHGDFAGVALLLAFITVVAVANLIVLSRKR